jgi:hypothetical protein
MTQCNLINCAHTQGRGCDSMMHNRKLLHLNTVWSTPDFWKTNGMEQKRVT